MSLKDTDYALGECLHCHNDYEIVVLSGTSGDFQDMYAVCSYCIRPYHLVLNITFFPRPTQECPREEHMEGYFAGGRRPDDD